MVANRSRSVAFVILVSCSAAAWAQRDEPPVAVNTQGLARHVAARVTDKAAQGITALRQYVWISRSVNQLDLRSLTRADEPRQVAMTGDEPATVAALNDAR